MGLGVTAGVGRGRGGGGTAEGEGEGEGCETDGWGGEKGEDEGCWVVIFKGGWLTGVFGGSWNRVQLRAY